MNVGKLAGTLSQFSRASREIRRLVDFEAPDCKRVGRVVNEFLAFICLGTDELLITKYCIVECSLSL